MEQPDWLPSAAARPWFVVVYRTSTSDAQQEILLRLSSLLRDDLHALASSNASDHFIVAEGASIEDRRLVERVVTAIDGRAHLLQAVSPWVELRGGPAPDRSAPPIGAPPTGMLLDPRERVADVG